MIFLVLLLVAAASWRAALSLHRLWAALPDRNIDFGLVPADLDLEPRP